MSQDPQAPWDHLPGGIVCVRKSVVWRRRMTEMPATTVAQRRKLEWVDGWIWLYSIKHTFHWSWPQWYNVDEKMARAEPSLSYLISYVCFFYNLLQTKLFGQDDLICFGNAVNKPLLHNLSMWQLEAWQGCFHLIVCTSQYLMRHKHQAYVTNKRSPATENHVNTWEWLFLYVLHA